MTTLATAADVRALGNLPAVDKLGDPIIAPHLSAAGRELASWLGSSYLTESDADKIADYKEAECCICLAYLQPVLHTLYTEGVTTLQRELGEINVQYLSPSNWSKVAGDWMQRAKDRMRDYVNKSETKSPVTWYAV